MSTKPMVECKFCKTDIPKGAQICPNCKKDLRGFVSRHPLVTIVVFMAIVWNMVSGMLGTTSRNINTPNPGADVVGSLPEIQQKPQIQSFAGMSTIKIIETKVEKIGNPEVSIWTLSGKSATEKSKPPFEVIANYWFNDASIGSCSDAKRALFEVMKAVYTQPELTGKVARVRFSAPHYLRAILWSSDATFDWSITGPTNFFKVLMDYKPFENEVGLVGGRTWWVDIGNCK